MESMGALSWIKDKTCSKAYTQGKKTLMTFVSGRSERHGSACSVIVAVRSSGRLGELKDQVGGVVQGRLTESS